MKTRPQSADEGLFSWIERWSPEHAEAWASWRHALHPSTRADVLVPLQAALSGLSAFRRLEYPPIDESLTDFRGHLRAVEVTYEWTRSLTRKLADESRGGGPDASLMALERSLTEALRSIESLSHGGPLDAASFGASSDAFLLDLDTNRFFRPSAPLEFANVEDLLGSEQPIVELRGSESPPSSSASVMAFVSLLRSHRVLGIADRQIAVDDGFHRALVLVAGTHRELLTLARFLRVQGVGALPDARDAVEALADRMERELESSLRDPMPEPALARSLAMPAERLRNAIRNLRSFAKDAARELRDLSGDVRRPGVRESMRVQKDLSSDIWAFRFIARAFIAKAQALPPRSDAWDDPEAFLFASEFARHYRVFGPTLAKGTGYARRGPLTAAVSVLGNRHAIDRDRLGLAVHECRRFVAHLDAALDERHADDVVPFDKNLAAAELREYLAAARTRGDMRPAAGAFGSRRTDR